MTRFPSSERVTIEKLKENALEKLRINDDASKEEIAKENVYLKQADGSYTLIGRDSDSNLSLNYLSALSPVPRLRLAQAVPARSPVRKQNTTEEGELLGVTFPLNIIIITSSSLNRSSMVELEKYFSVPRLSQLPEEISKSLLNKRNVAYLGETTFYVGMWKVRGLLQNFVNTRGGRLGSQQKVITAAYRIVDDFAASSCCYC